MRFCEFSIKTNQEYIKENAKIDLRVYNYQHCIYSVNDYMKKNLKNDYSFCIYREGEDIIFAAFSFDEKKVDYNNAVNYIFDILNDAFQIKNIVNQPEEITMYQFMKNIEEAQRHEFISGLSYFYKNAWLRDYYNNQLDKEYLHFSFKEKVIRDNTDMRDFLLDKRFIKELSNIEQHKNNTSYVGNIVHYILSGKSIEATSEMAEALLQSLYKANRISSRRMEIITEIEPCIYNKRNHLEDILESSVGGAVIIDLTEKFGYEPTEYVMASKYIENLVKKYRNSCLFVFTYDINHPGFSYMLLPELNKYVIPVELREGNGNRRAAVKYMEQLISKSDYAEYANQAAEYMERFPGNSFSQTDVINAYSQFDAWCLNKNILCGCDYELDSEFILDRDENAESSYDKLQKLIGLECVKKQIDSIIAADIIEKERKKRKGRDYQAGTMHMVFGGNPGSAKTTVAKLFGGIAKEKGILRSGAFVECGGMDLNGIGCVTEIREAFLAAKGGVLFIDEAYSLTGDTAVTVLIQEMENHRDDVIVILAGYNERMQTFLEINEGLKSRIPYWIEFPDYNTDELTAIFKFMLKERGFNATEDAVKEAHYLFEKARCIDNFGNGRYVRNIIEQAVKNQSVRLLAQNDDASTIKKSELFKLTIEDIKALDDGTRAERVTGTAKSEFDALIGLSRAKDIIRKAIANFRLNKLCMNRGISRDRSSMHMVFTGNPGTAKTTVARLFAEILKDEKVLSTGNFVEVGRADIVGDHVGATAKLVKKKFKEAQGGVLFIDEAYSLCDSYENGFGDEAINTIVQEMENHRDEVIVIFAGYPEPMKHFLERNPGMKSRTAFQIEFDDYKTEELCEITKLMLSRKKMIISDQAMKKLRKIYESVEGSKDFGNGRFVRKLLEEAEMNLAERILQMDNEEITDELITTIEENDIPTQDSTKKEEKRTIGFAR